MSRDSSECMQRCLQLAELGKGQTAPNPLVGAVLAYRDKIIGEGYHARYGAAHAEVDCLQNVAPVHHHLIPAATLYVSLEPCCHHGKTPPCTDLILRSGIKKVVVATTDPFPAVNSGGIRVLREAGVEVQVGMLENESRWMNRRFFTFHQQQRPYIVLKWAQTYDGFLGGETSERWLISNELSQRQLHQWRSEEQAILVGYRTALLDDPSLTTRLVPGKNPLRMVIDPKNALSAGLTIFQDGLPVVIFNELEDGRQGVVSRVKVEDKDWKEGIFTYCRRHQIQSILVEGGRATLLYFLQQGCWDEIRRVTNLNLRGNTGVPAPAIPNHTTPAETYFLDNDKVEIIYRDSIRDTKRDTIPS